MSIVKFDERKGKLRERIRILSEGIKKGPNYSSYQDFIERGTAYKNLREYGNAVKDFSFVLSINKNQVSVTDACVAIANRGWCYLKMREREKARRDFLIRCKLMPKSPNAYENLAVFYSMIKEPQNVIDVCTRLLSWFNSRYSHYLRGIAFFEMRRFDFSLKDLSVALNMNLQKNENEKLSGDIFLKRGDVFIQLKKNENALSNFTSAIKKYHIARNSIEKYNLEEDSLHQAYLSRGEIYMDLKKYKEAIYDFSKFMELNPSQSTTSIDYLICHRMRERAQKLLLEQEGSRNNTCRYDWNNQGNGMVSIVVDKQEEAEMFSVEENNSWIEEEEEDDVDTSKWTCLSKERERRGW